MNNTTRTNKYILLILATVILAAAGFSFGLSGWTPGAGPLPASLPVEDPGNEAGDVAREEKAPPEPAFEWAYSTSGQDEMPKTVVSLRVIYADGTSKTREIDTIEGSCNTYDPPDPDTYENSDMIICYYAGLGRYYKVVGRDGEYLVRRKVFEEASPEYDPPDRPFETVAAFQP